MWVKEFHGAREFGWRRDDNLAYVGKSAEGWWRPFVRANLDDALRQFGRKGFANDKDAQLAADLWLEEKERAA